MGGGGRGSGSRIEVSNKNARSRKRSFERTWFCMKHSFTGLCSGSSLSRGFVFAGFAFRAGPILNPKLANYLINPEEHQVFALKRITAGS